MAPITLNQNTLDPTVANGGFSQNPSKTDYTLGIDSSVMLRWWTVGDMHITNTDRLLLGFYE